MNKSSKIKLPVIEFYEIWSLIRPRSEDKFKPIKWNVECVNSNFSEWMRL
jgi:hypothetical protein